MTPRDTDSGKHKREASQPSQRQPSHRCLPAPPETSFPVHPERSPHNAPANMWPTVCEPLPRPALRRKNVVAIVAAVVVILQAQLEAVASGHNRNVNFLIFESSSECTVIRVGGNSLPICRLPGWQLAHPKRGVGGGRQVLSALSTSHTKSSTPDSHLYVHNLRPSVPLHLHLKCQASKNSTNFLLPSTSQRWGRRTPGRTGGK